MSNTADRLFLQYLLAGMRDHSARVQCVLVHIPDIPGRLQGVSVTTEDGQSREAGRCDDRRGRQRPEHRPAAARSDQVVAERGERG